uniref:Uncharacterized protein n=1 Tax=Craspedostauros australis TaxID=1486917 RepID=A0A7R9WQ50_9STRA|mmetsp:Transcript_12349/g.33967  ORF Transcript_12349/g.33967 Transcript_12349/m.33967 type:complete len:190 (+) Transcript_12349:135-704(+)|eukprot:CAMPEP_0198131110 /NCGR_PEP_ID=MMETSP1442-20131203/55408_1 /TAXON_ID= /ORGANISM="Craspedostauros australis, Strain CCMP3328" /LENGTH=189 /DNA_ID=CAMNT_0043791851 /DNA_START=86 /DNA_END=655 /DNA_ORIENTATION=+
MTCNPPSRSPNGAQNLVSALSDALVERNFAPRLPVNDGVGGVGGATHDSQKMEMHQLLSRANQQLLLPHHHQERQQQQLQQNRPHLHPHEQHQTEANQAPVAWQSHTTTAMAAPTPPPPGTAQSSPCQKEQVADIIQDVIDLISDDTCIWEDDLLVMRQSDRTGEAAGERPFAWDHQLFDDAHPPTYPQ